MGCNMVEHAVAKSEERPASACASKRTRTSRRHHKQRSHSPSKMRELECNAVGIARVRGRSGHPKRELSTRRAPSHAKPVTAGPDVQVNKVNHVVTTPHTLRVRRCSTSKKHRQQQLTTSSNPSRRRTRRGLAARRQRQQETHLVVHASLVGGPGRVTTPCEHACTVGAMPRTD